MVLKAGGMVGGEEGNWGMGSRDCTWGGGIPGELIMFNGRREVLFSRRDELISPLSNPRNLHEFMRTISGCNRLQQLKPNISPQFPSRAGIFSYT